MRIHNLYTDASGQSHFRDVEVEWVEETRSGKLSKRLPVIPAARFGDLSYGIYIYGWPVEQGVVWLLGGRAAWWQVFLLALPAAAALAFLSWHLVERPALRLKPAARRSPALRRDAGVEVGPAVSMASIGQS